MYSHLTVTENVRSPFPQHGVLDLEFVRRSKLFIAPLSRSCTQFWLSFLGGWGIGHGRQETRLAAVLGVLVLASHTGLDGAGWGVAPADPGTEEAGAAQVSPTLVTPAGLGAHSQTHLRIGTNWAHYKPLDKIPNGTLSTWIKTAVFMGPLLTRNKNIE